MGVFALNRYGGWRNLWAKINSRGIEKTYLHRKNLFEMLPAQDSAIVFLGNSITAQNEWAEVIGNPKVLNRGIPGDHCDGVAARLEEVVKNRPVKIFLLIGINDLAYHPVSTVTGKYERLVSMILAKAPAAELYLQSLFPINPVVGRFTFDNEDILALNREIERIARDKQLIFIDLHPLLLDKDGNLDAAYTQDGIHLNGAAYLKWKTILEPYLEP
jgi:lysophospholipase L1-like esterase